MSLKLYSEVSELIKHENKKIEKENKDKAINKFVAINKKGNIVFMEDVSGIALLNFVDSNNNRYLLSYSYPDLNLKKTDSLNKKSFPESLTLIDLTTFPSQIFFSKLNLMPN